MFLIIRSRGAYDSYYTTPTVFFLTQAQADKAVADANDWLDRAGLRGDRLYDSLGVDILYGDDDGSNSSWDAHVAKHGGLPDADPDLCPQGVCSSYGVHDYRVVQVKPGKVTA